MTIRELLDDLAGILLRYGGDHAVFSEDGYEVEEVKYVDNEGTPYVVLLWRAVDG